MADESCTVGMLSLPCESSHVQGRGSQAPRAMVQVLIPTANAWSANVRMEPQCAAWLGARDAAQNWKAQGIPGCIQLQPAGRGTHVSRPQHATLARDPGHQESDSPGQWQRQAADAAAWRAGGGEPGHPVPTHSHERVDSSMMHQLCDASTAAQASISSGGCQRRTY